jgi:hypothetical protein
MARPATLRRNIQILTAAASTELSVVWEQVSSKEQARAALFDVVPAVIDTYGVAAGAVTADWYDEAREEAGVRGRFTAIVPEIKDVGADALVNWATQRLDDDEPDWEAARILLDGGLERRIADVSRETVMGSSVQDPQARGWQRVTSGDGCEFCEMLASSGAVYTEESADFASHDHCLCSAVPAFGGEPKTVQPYTPSLRQSTPEDRARVRAWIKNNPQPR